MPPDRTLIIGAPRSGLDSCATYLTDNGIPCGHKEVYTFGIQEPPDWGNKANEASWLAVPFLPVDARVLLIVRHPLLVAASMLQITGTIREWAREKIHFFHDDLVSDSMNWWLAWNKRAIDHAHDVYFLEDLIKGPNFPHRNIWHPPPVLDWSMIDDKIATEAKEFWNELRSNHG